MDYKRFVLSYYKNAIQGIHIQRITGSREASKPHSHEYFQIYFVLCGSLLHTTAYGEETLSSGDICLLAPGEVHHIGQTQGVELFSLSFMPDIFGAASESNRFAVNFLKSAPRKANPCTKAVITERESELARELLEKIYAEFCEKRLGCGEVIRAYALALVMIFARNLTESIPSDPIGDETAERIAHCVQYIEGNFSDSIELAEMAHACAMSKSFFCKAFLAHTGTTFHKYLNGCRIRAALRYIEKGYKITGIYGLCGYNDFSTFYRNFKRITGCSPKDYFGNGKARE